MTQRGMTRRLACGALLTATAGQMGCSSIQSLNGNTMDVLYDEQQVCAAPAPVLLVFLPGAHMAPEEFVREGFLAAVRSRQLAVDMRVADAHLGYAYDGSMGRRLREDVLAPARAQGYRRIWLVGISLGGYVALNYLKDHATEIEGVVALAPYLGPQGWIAALEKSTEPAQRKALFVTQPGVGGATQRDLQLWDWLSQARPTSLPIHLGYGEADRFAPGHRVLATTLPPDQVRVVPGGHDWRPWFSLWTSWLDQKLLPTRCDSN
jgi:pimeloyl-ACP methyl ester carboxylesterase